MFRFYWITCMGGGMVGVGAWWWRGDAGTFTFVAFRRGSRGGDGGVTRCVPGLKKKNKRKETLPRLCVAPLLGQGFEITWRGGRFVIKLGKNGMERSQWKKK